MKSKVLILPITLLLLMIMGRSLSSQEAYQLTADIEARSPDGEILAMQTVQATTCEPAASAGCTITWDWAGHTFPAGTQEWCYARFVLINPDGIVEVAAMPDWCGVDLRFCATDTHVSTEPSPECISELFQKCGVERDQRGFFSNGVIVGGEMRGGTWYEPLEPEWYDTCPSPPPTWTPYVQATYTPQPPHTPKPMPTCRFTSTPNATYTPLPTSTPLPASTPWPTQPPW